MGNTQQRTIHVIGCGGAGFWMLVGMSRAGVLGIKAYDDDNLQGGLGHQRLPMATPTTKKVDLLRGFIRASLGGEPPATVDGRFRGTEARKNDIVLDCSDMSGVQRRTIYDRVVKRGARYIRVSYDGANSTAVVAEGLPIVTDETASGYASVPSLGLSLLTGGFAAEVLTKVVNGEVEGQHIEFQVSVNQLLGLV